MKNKKKKKYVKPELTKYFSLNQATQLEGPNSAHGSNVSEGCSGTLASDDCALSKPVGQATNPVSPYTQWCMNITGAN